MSKVFIVPDVHLKPWMFEKASELISEDLYDAVVFLGDLVDDWHQERNIDLYKKTFDAAISFAGKHPNTFWCFGNHDVSYLWEAMETGYSFYARETVVTGIKDLKESLPKENFGFAHVIDNVVFSHAGLTQKFISRHFSTGKTDLDTMVSRINMMDERELWTDDSPIWARPQYGDMKLFSNDIYQVVGHTPVSTVLDEGNLLTLDTFSTYSDGRPIGDERFVWVDTIEEKWKFAGKRDF